MRLLELKDLPAEHFKAFAESDELTGEEMAEVSRLFMAQLPDADRQACANWEDATPFEDFLRALKEEQRQRDEQRP